MPATASTALAGPAASVRPVQAQPHANGPSRSMAQATPVAQHRLHKHSTSADITDARLQKPSQHKHDKELPPNPPSEPRLRISRPTQMTEAERYKAQSQQKSSDKDSPATPSSLGHSLSSSRGHSSSQHHGHNYSSSHGHTMTTASQSSHTSGSSVGRHRSATVAGYHGGGNGLDTSTSSSSSAQGHSSSSKLRRKPVRTFEETPTEHFKWEPGSEPMVISPTDETMPMTGSGRSRNRSIGVYRDPPTSAAIPMNGQATWSRATGASAASSTKTIGQGQYVLQDAHNRPLPSTTSLGRHHHSASASTPVGSHRTTVQTFFTPNGATTSSNQNSDKLMYRASSNGHGGGSASSNTPTPKANQFATTPTQSHAIAHANAHNAKSHKFSISASDIAVNATAPAGSSQFTIPMNSSSDERRSHRARKESHRRTASASTSGHAKSPSTASASTEGSSHGDGEGDSDLWKSGTSISQMSQSHASMGQKRGQQHSSSQQRIPSPPQQSQRRSRGISDAPAPQAHYLVNLPSRKDEKEGYRPDTAMSGRGDEDRGRGRTKEKDTSFLGRVRARSNSLTKGLSKAIQYPIYLAKGGSKRSSKQMTANANGSNGALAYSDLGHGGRTSGEDAFEYAYTPSTTTTSTTTASTAASPVSSKHPGNGNPSKSSVNILPAQHQYTPTKAQKREHKRSLSAQPALGHTPGLSPPPQQRSTGPAPSAFQRLKKPLTAREREQRDMNRASPMTRAKDDVLQMWEGVDVDPRRSGVVHAQIQVSQSRLGEGGVAFPRFEGRERGEMRSYAPMPSIPFAVGPPRRR